MWKVWLPLTTIIKKEAGRAHIHIVYDALLSMLDSFEDVRASFVRKGGNIVAHIVARWETDF